MKRLLTILTMLAAVGCQTNRYEQKAGLDVAIRKDAPTNHISVVYGFDTNGIPINITVTVVGAEELTLADTSELASKSLISESQFGAAGSREGMLGNDTKVEGNAKTKQELDGVVGELKALAIELKKP